MDSYQFVNHFISLLVIANPLSALPAVLRITQNMNLPEKRRTGIRGGISVGIILVLVTWIGTPLLMILSIQLPAFQVAGGLILLMMAFSMLNAEESAIKSTTEEQKGRLTASAAIVPLAIPIIAGPAAISTVIVSVNVYPGLFNQLLITISCMLVALSMGILLYFASNLEKILGKAGINIINRVGGLILAAIAVQSLANGLMGIFPGLKTV